MTRLPDEGLTVIVLTNADGAQPAEIAAGVARLYVPPSSSKSQRH
jgi:hypothetical protein